MFIESFRVFENFKMFITFYFLLLRLNKNEYKYIEHSPGLVCDFVTH